MTVDEAKILKSMIDPVIAASLLTAVYSYLAWRKPMDYDDKTFADAYTLVVKQWGTIMQSISLPPQGQGQQKDNRNS